MYLPTEPPAECWCHYWLFARTWPCVTFESCWLLNVDEARPYPGKHEQDPLDPSVLFSVVISIRYGRTGDENERWCGEGGCLHTFRLGAVPHRQCLLEMERIFAAKCRAVRCCTAPRRPSYICLYLSKVYQRKWKCFHSRTHLSASYQSAIRGGGITSGRRVGTHTTSTLLPRWSHAWC